MSKSRKKGPQEPPAKEITQIRPGIRHCRICNQSLIAKGTNEVEKAGRFFTNGSHFFHYFCLLFSTNGRQKGSDDEGILGFLKKDINDVLVSSQNSKCVYCHAVHATTKCKNPGCDNWYHFTCGKAEGALFIFSNMNSYCHLHWPKSKHKLKFPDKICMSGCQEEVQEEKEPFFISPCCGRMYHIDCVQNMALSYGRAHFKCPLCQDKDAFFAEAVNFGVYIPTKDADWERPDQEQFYAYQQMGELYTHCDAEYCACTKGRKFSFPGTRFEIIRCSNCGSKAVHIYCGGLMLKAPFFVCDDHEGAKEEMAAFARKAKKRLKQENLSDSDSAIKDDHWIKPNSSKIVCQGPIRKNRLLSKSPKPSTSSKKVHKRKRSMTPPPPAAKNTEQVDSSDDDDVQIVSEEVKVPLKLVDPKTNIATTMPVGPIIHDFELSPSMEGLGLRLGENLSRYMHREINKSPSISSVGNMDLMYHDDAIENDHDPSLPKIVAGFSLRDLKDDDDDEDEVIELD